MAKLERAPRLNRRHLRGRIEDPLTGPHHGRIGEVTAAKLKMSPRLDRWLSNLGSSWPN